jgi:pimeloyl-ACP methyl ester carboxylesterase
MGNVTDTLDCEVLGNGPRVVFVHGSVNDGPAAFSAQRPLAERWQIVIANRRGYGKNPPIQRVDVQRDAEDVSVLLDDGAHLVGTSMGGIVAGMAAGIAPARVLSLTLIEPPAFTNCRDIPLVAEHAQHQREYWDKAKNAEPAEFLRGFLEVIHARVQLPSPLPASFLVATRNLMTERPWKNGIPVEPLRNTPFPKLVISSGDSPAFEAICGRLASELRAERKIFPGAGHAVQRIGQPFNDALEQFMQAAASAGARTATQRGAR